MSLTDRYPERLLNEFDAEENYSWRFSVRGSSGVTGPMRIYKIDRRYYDADPKRGRLILETAYECWLEGLRQPEPEGEVPK